MKKKLFAIMLAAMCFFCAFSFVGCTDKTRQLTAVEKQLVGDWGVEDYLQYTFKADGTFIFQLSNNKSTGTFTATKVSDGFYKVEVKKDGKVRLTFGYNTNSPNELVLDNGSTCYRM